MGEVKANIIYGVNSVEELIKNRLHDIDRIYIDRDKTSGRPFSILKLARKKKINCQCIPKNRLEAISGTLRHQGVVALCNVKSYDTEELLWKRLKECNTSPLLLLPASVEDPGNLGAIIRSAAAFDVTAILVERKKTAPLNSVVAKRSAGLIESVSIVKPNSLEAVLKKLIDMNFEIIGLEGGNHTNPWEGNFSKPTVIVSGGEHSGIPPYIKKLCTGFISIPMNKNVESLNVSNAVSVALYEVTKQRISGK